MFKEYCVFDLASALYFWLQHNWEGQTDPLYAAWCQLTEPGYYKPSLSQENFDNIEEMALEVYETLTVDNYEEALSLVLNYESEE